MKKLGIGFSALVAIAAIGLTITAQDGVFEAKATKLTLTGCYDVRVGLGIPAIVAAPDCEENVILSSEQDCARFTGWKLFTDASGAAQINPATDCPGSNKMCCVIYQIDTEETCPRQPEVPLSEGLNFYKVNQIFCTLP